MKLGERKKIFIEHDISRNVNSAFRMVKELESLVEVTIPKEDTSF
jgi:hypothetical protein